MSGSLGLGLLGSFPRRERRQCSLATQNCLDFGGPLFLVGKTNSCLPQRTCRNLFRGLSDWRLALLLCYQKPEITICERAVNLFCRDGTFFCSMRRTVGNWREFFLRLRKDHGFATASTSFMHVTPWRQHAWNRIEMGCSTGLEAKKKWNQTQSTRDWIPGVVDLFVQDLVYPPGN